MWLHPGIPEADAELQRDYTGFKINALCTRCESGIIRVICFDKASPLVSFAKQFYVLTKRLNSSLFRATWKTTINQARKDNPNLSLRDLESVVWVPVFCFCQNMLHRLRDQTMTLGEVDTHFKNYQKRELTTQLKLLYDGINTCMKQQLSDNWIQDSIQKVSDYRQLCGYHDAANAFLQLRDLLNLSEGDFRDVERISTEVISLVCASYILLCVHL